MSNGEPVEGARRRILVGVDGSADGLRAVRYALREALASDSDLWIVHAVDDTALSSDLWSIVIPLQKLEEIGRGFVQDALDVVAAEGFPPDRVTSEVVVGPPGDVLSRMSGEADLLVVGRRSMSGLERMFVGSTSVAVAGHATCPVIVISASSTPDRTGDAGVVAVGIGARSLHGAALEWGAREAELRKARLRVVHVVPVEVGVPESVFASASESLEAALADLRTRYPGTTMTVEVIPGNPIDELIALSHEVDLLVLGVHPARLSGLARGVLAHSASPVGLTR